MPKKHVWDYVNRSMCLHKNQWDLTTEPADPPAIQELKYADRQSTAKHLYFLSHHGLTVTPAANLELIQLAFPSP